MASNSRNFPRPKISLSPSKVVAKASPKPANSATKLRVPVERAIERCVIYRDGHPVRGSYGYREALEEVRRTGSGYVWLGLYEPDQHQMVSISEAYDVHELIVEDAVSARQRPKVERYDDQFFFVIRSVKYTDDAIVNNAREIIETGEVQMIVGKDFIITVRHGEQSTIPGLKRRLESDPEQCAMGPTAVSWLISDVLVDEYLRISSLLSTDIDELENEVFSPGTRFDIEQIYRLKREILEMRHAIDPLALALRTLTNAHNDLLSEEISSYFLDVLDHELAAADHVASHDERLTSLINAGVAKVSMQQNADMRRLSALVGMAAVPTMIAGIYGMNFENMPELSWQYGYFAVLGVMLASIVAMYWFFKKNNWL
ncbi:magnesium/cobalt transporter CorA [Corynebacterium epidermidicanis]|uniref:Magnesium transport protein CorA n=1 Tax=Corynebacterium epidermidicanis TaxID=1050174 RepID=A0A0G3GNV7_9CORY|nr:magnesium/cobalt transporter CorA [Corynebacterium epidermidicanis]AKK02834.1 magnesium Mg(2+) and cobalt Co(2+) transport protein CorA [Corynebacterium epidermidicanis]